MIFNVSNLGIIKIKWYCLVIYCVPYFIFLSVCNEDRWSSVKTGVRLLGLCRTPAVPCNRVFYVFIAFYISPIFKNLQKKINFFLQLWQIPCVFVQPLGCPKTVDFDFHCRISMLNCIFIWNCCMARNWCFRNRYFFQTFKFLWKKSAPCRGIEPRSPAWQAGILTTILTRIW